MSIEFNRRCFDRPSLLRHHQSALRRRGFAGLAGGMMNEPLLISSLIEHADRHHPDAEVVSRRPEDGAIHRHTYRCVCLRLCGQG